AVPPRVLSGGKKRVGGADRRGELRQIRLAENRHARCASSRHRYGVFLCDPVAPRRRAVGPRHPGYRLAVLDGERWAQSAAGSPIDVDVGVDAGVKAIDRRKMRFHHGLRIDLSARDSASDVAKVAPAQGVVGHRSSITARMMLSNRFAAVSTPNPITPLRSKVSSAESEVIRSADHGTPF